LSIDKAAPFSSANVLQASYPIGFPTGVAPGTLHYAHADAKCVFGGFLWKMSNPWQGNDAGSQKMGDWWGPSQGHLVFRMNGGLNGPWRFDLSTSTFNGDSQFIAGTMPGTTRTSVLPGVWYRLEYLLKYSSTSTTHDGSVRWWASSWNGTAWSAPVLQGFNNAVMWDNMGSGLGDFSIYPGFGGNGQPKYEQDYVWYDHVHVSRCAFP
jgi:hypothetical protein